MQKVEQMAETIKTFQVAQIGEYIIRRVIVEISNRIFLLLPRASQNSHILVSDLQISRRQTPMTGQAGGIPGAKATSQQKVLLRAKNRLKKLLRKLSKMTIKIIN